MRVVQPDDGQRVNNNVGRLGIVVGDEGDHAYRVRFEDDWPASNTQWWVYTDNQLKAAEPNIPFSAENLQRFYAQIGRVWCDVCHKSHRRREVHKWVCYCGRTYLGLSDDEDRICPACRAAMVGWR